MFNAVATSTTVVASLIAFSPLANAVANASALTVYSSAFTYACNCKTALSCATFRLYYHSLPLCASFIMNRVIYMIYRAKKDVRLLVPGYGHGLQDFLDVPDLSAVGQRVLHNGKHSVQFDGFRHHG